jgi:hypothetical protein
VEHSNNEKIPAGAAQSTKIKTRKIKLRDKLGKKKERRRTGGGGER